MSFRGRIVGAVSALTTVTLGGAFYAVFLVEDAAQHRGRQLLGADRLDLLVGDRADRVVEAAELGGVFDEEDGEERAAEGDGRERGDRADDAPSKAHEDGSVKRNR